MKMPPFFVSIAKAGGARGLALVSSLLFTAIASRIVFESYGAEAFGIVTFIASLQYLIPFADLGLGAVIMNRVALANGQGHISRSYSIIFRSVKLQALLAFILGLILLVSCVFAGPIVYFGDTASVSTLSIATAGIAILTNVPMSFGNRALIGLNATHIGIYISAIAPPIVLVFVLACSSFGLDEAFLYPIWPLAALISSVAISVAATRRLKLNFLKLLDGILLTRTRNREDPIWGTALSMIFISIASPLTHNSHRVVLAATVNAQAIATYSLGAQIFSPLLSLISSAATPLWSAFASDKGTKKSFLSATVGFGLIGLVAGLGLFIGIPTYSWFITGTTTYVPWPVIASFAAFLVVNALSLPSMMRLNNGIDIKFQAWVTSLACLIGLPFSFWGASIWGPSGPLVASAVVMALVQLIPMLVWQLMSKKS